ncbi:MAG: riboflavin biosynthesis protein RibF [Deltaproteobacteria bacterium]|nr:riboflavin biosynthesis protein RibF [Deltaproteobacteria bacterium]
MERIQGWPAAPLGPSAVAFGNFDGLHVGHRAIIGSLRAAAVGFGGGVTLATFDPHPLSLLRPERAPRAIDPLALRLARFAEAGVDRTVVLRFDETLRQTSALDFADRLFRQLGARVVVASSDSRFGAGGRGDIALLRAAAARNQARVLQIPAVSRDGERVSSSRVRRLIEAGDVEQAWALLERPFELDGEVVHGDARGRTIGFPTANLATAGQVAPAAGVYVAQLLVDGAWLPAVANLGLRPTVDGASWRTEAHVLDRAIDLYGKRVRLRLLRHLRGERRFADLDALRAAIAEDADAARRMLAVWFERGALA